MRISKTFYVIFGVGCVCAKDFEDGPMVLEKFSPKERIKEDKV